MTKQFFLFTVIGFLLGCTLCICLYFFVFTQFSSFSSKNINLKQQVRQGGYTYINPLLECEASEDISRQEYSWLKSELPNKVNSYLVEDKIATISVYFRDLNNGPWFGINAQQKFTPASLLKVPLMMAFYKQAETDKDVLSRNVEAVEDANEDDDVPLQSIVPDEKLADGSQYTADELIRRMIIFSDNRSMRLLLKEINPDIYDKVYTDLSLHTPDLSEQENYMSVVDYASFLRILYNASYLSKEMSEKALKLLSETSYKKALVAGVPEGVTVAHKFGERSYKGENIKQLHDCGVIYHAQSPYLLCVMTRGDSFDEQATVIADISKFIYTNVDESIKK